MGPALEESAGERQTVGQITRAGWVLGTSAEEWGAQVRSLPDSTEASITDAFLDIAGEFGRNDENVPSVVASFIAYATQAEPGMQLVRVSYLVARTLELDDVRTADELARVLVTLCDLAEAVDARVAGDPGEESRETGEDAAPAGGATGDDMYDPPGPDTADPSPPSPLSSILRLLLLPELSALEYLPQLVQVALGQFSSAPPASQPLVQAALGAAAAAPSAAVAATVPLLRRLLTPGTAGSAPLAPHAPATDHELLFSINRLVQLPATPYSIADTAHAAGVFTRLLHRGRVTLPRLVDVVVTHVPYAVDARVADALLGARFAEILHAMHVPDLAAELAKCSADITRVLQALVNVGALSLAEARATGARGPLTAPPPPPPLAALASGDPAPAIAAFRADTAAQRAVLSACTRALDAWVAAGDLMAISSLCSALIDEPALLAVAFVYVPPSTLLAPLRTFLETHETSSELYGESHALERYGVVVLCLQTVLLRFALYDDPVRHLGAGTAAGPDNPGREPPLQGSHPPLRDGSPGFFLHWLHALPATYPLSALSAAERTLLAGWIAALFGEGISDELLQATSVRTLLRLAPTLCQQALAACDAGAIDFDTLVEGLSYFGQELLSFTLPGVVAWACAEATRSCTHAPRRDRLLRVLSQWVLVRLPTRAVLALVVAPLQTLRRVLAAAAPADPGPFDFARLETLAAGLDAPPSRQDFAESALALLAAELDASIALPVHEQLRAPYPLVSVLYNACASPALLPPVYVVAVAVGRMLDVCERGGRSGGGGGEASALTAFQGTQAHQNGMHPINGLHAASGAGPGAFPYGAASRRDIAASHAAANAFFSDPASVLHAAPSSTLSSHIPRVLPQIRPDDAAVQIAACVLLFRTAMSVRPYPLLHALVRELLPVEIADMQRRYDALTHVSETKALLATSRLALVVRICALADIVALALVMATTSIDYTGALREGLDTVGENNQAARLFLARAGCLV